MIITIGKWCGEVAAGRQWKNCHLRTGSCRLTEHLLQKSCSPIFSTRFEVLRGRDSTRQKKLEITESV